MKHALTNVYEYCSNPSFVSPKLPKCILPYWKWSKGFLLSLHFPACAYIKLPPMNRSKRISIKILAKTSGGIRVIIAHQRRDGLNVVQHVLNSEIKGPAGREAFGQLKGMNGESFRAGGTGKRHRLSYFIQVIDQRQSHGACYMNSIS